MSSGNFKNDPARAAAAGRIGGRISPGNFKNNPERARTAGKRGGSK
ncbi:MAG: stress-induced protein [Candidatus Saccharimonadales bacterium]